MSVEDEDREIALNHAGQRMADIHEFKSVVSTNLPISMIQRIQNFQHRYRIQRKNDAMFELLRLGLYLEAKLGLVENIQNDELDSLKQQIESGQIVDYIATIDQRKFDLLINIFKDEKETRIRRQKQ